MTETLHHRGPEEDGYLIDGGVGLGMRRLRILDLEGGTHGLIFSSGMGALTTLLLHFSSGDHLLASEDLYGGTYRVLDQIFANVAQGIRAHVDYDTFAILLLDELGQQLEFRFAVGFPDDVVRSWRFGLGPLWGKDKSRQHDCGEMQTVIHDPRLRMIGEIVQQHIRC